MAPASQSTIPAKSSAQQISVTVHSMLMAQPIISQSTTLKAASSTQARAIQVQDLASKSVARQMARTRSRSSMTVQSKDAETLLRLTMLPATGSALVMSEISALQKGPLQIMASLLQKVQTAQLLAFASSTASLSPARSTIMEQSPAFKTVFTSVTQLTAKALTTQTAYSITMSTASSLQTAAHSILMAQV